MRSANTQRSRALIYLPLAMGTLLFMVVAYSWAREALALATPLGIAWGVASMTTRIE